jgi:hypothetical protein
MIKEVGKILYDLLSSVEISDNVNLTNIFPLIAENGTTFPFVTYKRVSCSENTKDYSTEAVVDLTVCNNTYDGSVDIADKIITALKGTKEDARIDILDTSEDYNEDTYI